MSNIPRFTVTRETLTNSRRNEAIRKTRDKYAPVGSVQNPSATVYRQVFTCRLCRTYPVQIQNAACDKCVSREQNRAEADEPIDQSTANLMLAVGLSVGIIVIYLFKKLVS